MINSQGKLPICIQRLDYKQSQNYGKFYLVGSIPLELTTPRQTMFGLQHDSNYFDTEDDAIKALLAIGITKFQLSDCSWYSGGK
jgi:hypothetical protein